MKIKATIVGYGAYSSSKSSDEVQEQDGENQIDLEHRRKKARCHLNTKKQVVLPSISLKNMLATTAKRIGMKVPGNKRATFTKNFVSGVIPQSEDPVLLVNGKPITMDEIGKDEFSRYEPVFCHSDGKREGGSNKRVTRFYPYFTKWSANVEFEILDPVLSAEIVIQHLVAAGIYNGIGRFRPQNGGLHGRFKVIVDGKEIDQTVSVSAEEETE